MITSFCIWVGNMIQLNFISLNQSNKTMEKTMKLSLFNNNHPSKTVVCCLVFLYDSHTGGLYVCCRPGWAWHNNACGCQAGQLQLWRDLINWHASLVAIPHIQKYIQYSPVYETFWKCTGDGTTSLAACTIQNISTKHRMIYSLNSWQQSKVLPKKCVW